MKAKLTLILMAAPMLGAVLTLSPAVAAEPELLMRSGGGSSFRIPTGSSWSSATPTINNERQVALSINSVAPSLNAGVWKGTLEAGMVVDISDDDEALYSDVRMNNAGDIVWRRAFSALDGIMKYDAAEDETVHLTNAPIGASSWTSVQIGDNDVVGYRTGFSGGNAWTSYAQGAATIHLAETGVDSNSDYAFLFSPSLGPDDQLVGKAAFQNFSQNRIISVTPAGQISIIVEDENLDAESPFANFDNSISLADDGRVAFIGGLAGNVRGVFVADDQGWTQYAITGEDGLATIESFAPAMNNHGVVVFRGFNDNGDRAIWRADGKNTIQVVTAGDLVNTDLGQSRLESATGIGGPNFGGQPVINDLGDIVFVSLLTNPDNPGTSHGRGLFLVPGAAPDPVFEDRFEDSMN